MTTPDTLLPLVDVLAEIVGALHRLAPPGNWEYTCFKAGSDEELIADLNRYADDGWQLVYIDRSKQRVLLRRARDLTGASARS